MASIKKPRGFAALTPEHRQAISSKGGKAATLQGKAHKYTPETARAAGRLGGKATQAKHAAKKDPHRLVQVGCSSASGCAGVAHTDEAGEDFVGEIPNKGARKPAVDDMLGEALSGTAEGDEGASCGGKSGCGSKSA